MNFLTVVISKKIPLPLLKNYVSKERWGEQACNRKLTRAVTEGKVSRYMYNTLVAPITQKTIWVGNMNSFGYLYS